MAEEIDLEQVSPPVYREGLDRRVDLDGGVVHQRPQRPDVVGVGYIDHQRLYTRPPDGVGVPLTPDPREDVKPPPEDVAHTVVFLASGLARHLTGATLDINGASYVR